MLSLLFQIQIYSFFDVKLALLGRELLTYQDKMKPLLILTFYQENRVIQIPNLEF